MPEENTENRLPNGFSDLLSVGSPNPETSLSKGLDELAFAKPGGPDQINFYNQFATLVDKEAFVNLMKIYKKESRRLERINLAKEHILYKINNKWRKTKAKIETPGINPSDKKLLIERFNSDVSKIIQRNNIGNFLDIEPSEEEINKIIVIDSSLPIGGGDGGLEDKITKFNDIENDKSVAKEDKEEAFVEDLDEDPVYTPKNKELTTGDRMIFIITTYFIRLIVLFILEWGINTHYITTFRDAYIDYIMGYIGIFALWVILANINENPYEENILLSTLFYCVNYKDHIMNKFHIFIHCLAQIILLPLLYIIKFKSKPIDQDSFEQKQGLINAISNFTFFIWVITSLIASRF